jgi:hypothetical protein
MAHIIPRFRMMPDGGFVCGDTVSRVTAYAYPTSCNARAAVRKPDGVAMEMLRDAVKFQPLADHAAQAWPRLASDMAEVAARRWIDLGEVA